MKRLRLLMVILVVGVALLAPDAVAAEGISVSSTAATGPALPTHVHPPGMDWRDCPACSRSPSGVVNPDAAREQAQEGEARAVGPGKLVIFYFVFGPYDFVNVLEVPDDLQLARKAVFGARRQGPTDPRRLRH